ncbi:MAG: hypothetical protein NTY75_05235, partial [Candidatus Shapirobacteria bacterium]|nr:hypothetical protein [Candidatus Shapirobacteria bacterium]
GVRSEWDIGKTVMYLTVSEHRIFHERRGILFDSKQDYDEAAAMESRMSFRQKQEYKAIKSNQQSIKRIDQEILRRDKEWFGEC